MCMTLTLNLEISDRRYQNDLTDEDINIIYSALLNYGKNIADRYRIGRTDQAALRRTDRLSLRVVDTEKSLRLRISSCLSSASSISRRSSDSANPFP